jgi:ectoine hydroxylase
LDVPAGGTLPPTYAESPDWISNLTASLKYSVGRDVVGQLVERHGIVAPKGPRGSVLLFHPDLVHASSPNLSPYDRPLVIISYNSVRNAPDPAGLHRPDFLICRDTRPLKPCAAGIAPQPAGR